MRLCDDDPDKAAAVLGLGPAQRDLVQRNADLRSAPTARADAIYTGVLYDALGFDTLSPAARRRATARVAITSALFGIVRGFAFAFVVVLIGGLAGVSREPWWTQALFSPPMESAVIAAKPWLPAEVADKIRFR